MREEHYDEHSEIVEWHWWYRGRKKIILSHLEKYFPDGGQILDVGCGPGGMLTDLNIYGKVYGIDSSLKSIKLCRKKGYLNTCVSDVENLPFRESHFSLISMLDVLEHVDNDRDVLKEMVRVCKPGGIILLTVPAFQFLWGNMDIVVHHKRRYTIPDIKTLNYNSGLIVDNISYFNFFLFPVIAVIRMVERLAMKWLKNEDTVRSDFSLSKPGIVNKLLTLIFSLESRLLLLVNLPFGVSIISVLRKPVR